MDYQIDDFISLGACVLILIMGTYFFLRIIPSKDWRWQGAWSTFMAAAICFVWPPPELWPLPICVYTIAIVFFVTLKVTQSYTTEKGEFYAVDSDTINAFFNDD